jgi:hypothetical protein
MGANIQMKRQRKIFISARLILCVLFSLLVVFSFSQNVKDSSLAFPLLKFSYAYQVPGGDLAKRFGVNSNVGINLMYKSKKNLLLGVNGSYLFGNKIKEIGILDSMKTSTSSGPNTGFVINQNGNPEVIRLFERGFTFSAYLGKMFVVPSVNKNSGIQVYAGPVFLRHKIKIYDVGNQAPQVSREYAKGYDRLTAGWGLQEFIGFTYLSNNRILNFFIGFEFTQAFTKNWRGYNYDLMQEDNARRTDLLYGIRAGWILPLYSKPPQEFYYY